MRLCMNGAPRLGKFWVTTRPEEAESEVVWTVTIVLLWGALESFTGGSLCRSLLSDCSFAHCSSC